MKLSGAGVDKALRSPDPQISGYLLFGPDRGLVRSRAAVVFGALATDLNDPFKTATLGEDTLKSDPAALADEMAAPALTGGDRVLRLVLNTDTLGGACATLFGDIDAGEFKPAARIVIEAGDLSPRSKLRQAFEKAKCTAAIGCYPPGARDLARLATERLDRWKVRLASAAQDALIERLPADHGLALQELDKLALYVGVAGGEATLTDIDAVIAPDGGAGGDALASAAFSGAVADVDAGVRRALNQGVAPVGLIRQLARHGDRLSEAANLIAQGAGTDAALRALNPPVFKMQVAAFTAQLRTWSADRLARLMRHIYETEAALKTSGAPDRALISMLYLDVARAGARPRR
ncbi:MAG: DNA polymerase III subunit delta [Maricaulaceae bacterium]